MHLKQNLFFSLLKSKNWRETQSFFGFPLHRSKTVLSIFGSFYNTVYESTFNFQFSWRLFFDVKGRILQIFKKIHFKVPAIFGNENFAACVTRTRMAKFADFLEITS